MEGCQASPDTMIGPVLQNRDMWSKEARCTQGILRAKIMDMNRFGGRLVRDIRSYADNAGLICCVKQFRVSVMDVRGECFSR